MKILTMLMMIIVLTGCNIPARQVICTLDGKETFRSEVSYEVGRSSRTNQFFIDNSYYTPRRGELCTVHRVKESEEAQR